MKALSSQWDRAGLSTCRGAPLFLPHERQLWGVGYFQLCDFHFHISSVGGVVSCGRIRFLPRTNFKRRAGGSVPDTQLAAAGARQHRGRAMDDQRDLISNHEQVPILGQRPREAESKCGRGALYTGFSVLVALLLAGQATTAYFLYQQQGQLHKLTVTSQNLQLENLRMKLPKPAKPLSKMRMATPLLMRALPMDGLPQGPVQNATKYGNMTQDHVMHLLLKADPLKVYPQLKGSFPENLKHLKSTMETMDWKVFESWMHQWLLFEMSKNSMEEKPTEPPTKEPLEMEDQSSGLGVTKMDLGQVML